jgi:hypothetical protein
MTTKRSWKNMGRRELLLHSCFGHHTGVFVFPPSPTKALCKATSCFGLTQGATRGCGCVAFHGCSITARLLSEEAMNYRSRGRRLVSIADPQNPHRLSAGLSPHEPLSFESENLWNNTLSSLSVANYIQDWPPRSQASSFHSRFSRSPFTALQLHQG